MNGTLHTVDGRPTIRVERKLAHPREKVWRAITDPEHLSQWYPFRAVELDLRVGGKIKFDDGAGTIMYADVVELNPPRVFAFSQHAPEAMPRESDDLVHIELVPDGDGCTLIFTHVFDDRPAAASYCTGWNFCINGLELLLDGREVTFGGDTATAHEEFAKKFGLSEGAEQSTADGWRVRFERQLTKPAATVWEVLGGAAAIKRGAAVPYGFCVRAFDPGPISNVAPESALEYEWQTDDGATAGHVRWEFSQGTGHGTRLVLTQTGTGAEAKDAALRQWREYIDEVAGSLAGLAN